MPKTSAQLDREIADALTRSGEQPFYGLRIVPSERTGYAPGKHVLQYKDANGMWFDIGNPKSKNEAKAALKRESKRLVHPSSSSLGRGRLTRSHATKKSTARDWTVRQMTSGRRVVEKTRGDKTARIFQGEGHWTVTLNRAPRGPFETTGEIARQSAKTLSAAKSLGTRLLKARA